MMSTASGIQWIGSSSVLTRQKKQLTTPWPQPWVDCFTHCSGHLKVFGHVDTAPAPVVDFTVGFFMAALRHNSTKLCRTFPYTNSSKVMTVLRILNNQLCLTSLTTIKMYFKTMQSQSQLPKKCHESCMFNAQFLTKPGPQMWKSLMSAVWSFL